MAQSNLERAFLTQWRLLAPDASAPVEEYRFAAAHVGLGPGIRKRLKAAGLQDWRFDFCWFVPNKVAVECDGGIYTRGRHTRGKGFEGDIRKINAAQRLGWTVYRVTAGMLRDDPAGFVEMVREALAAGVQKPHES